MGLLPKLLKKNILRTKTKYSNSADDEYGRLLTEMSLNN